MSSGSPASGLPQNQVSRPSNGPLKIKDDTCDVGRRNPTRLGVDTI
jgi:hypothetical protein